MIPKLNISLKEKMLQYGIMYKLIIIFMINFRHFEGSENASRGDLMSAVIFLEELLISRHPPYDFQFTCRH